MSLGDAYADAHLDTDSLDADIAQVSAMLANAVEQWQSILNVTGTVDLDTDEATAQLEAAVAAWNGMLDENLASAVDLDTSEATAQLVSARSQWTSLLAEPIEARVQVVVEDAESIANLAATFTGIKPLLDLPVRFHIDQASVVEVTTAISGYAAVWSDALDIKVTPTVRPEGGNDLPSRPGEPARPRGPPGEPVIRPQVDGTDAEIQAQLLSRVLEGILTAAATIRIDGDTALAEAETLAPLIERIVSTNAEVSLDGEGLIEHAEAIRQLVEQTLADAKARPSLDGGVLIGQIEALAAAIDDILDVTAAPDLDESAFRAKLIALSAEVETIIGSITVGIDPEVDPERSVADARLIKRLIEGVLKVTVPVDMSDTEAVAQAEALKPLIERILRISTTVDLDGAGAVAEAEAIGSLLDEALDIAMKVDLDSGGATAQAAALKATVNALLRDLVINIDLDGGEATAHAVALRAVLERVLGRDIEVNVDVDQASTAVSGFSRLLSSVFQGGGDSLVSGKNIAEVFGKIGSGALGAVGVLAKFGAILAAVAAAIPLLLGGLSALAAAAGGIVGLAAAFATLAVSIGGAAAAMPILGVALNKDLVEKAKDGLAELKANVAAVTRDLGEQLLGRFQGPFVTVLSQIAASASKLGDALFPVLEAVIGFLGKFNAALQSSDARQFVDKLSSSVVEWIDMFGDYLDDYLSLVNDVFGSTSGIRDFVQAILDLGLQAGPLFKSIGTFLSEMSKGISALGPVALPLVEKLVNLLTEIGNSDPFQQMVRGGIAMFSILLDLIDQIGDGIQNSGFDEAMGIMLDAFQRLADAGFGETIGRIFTTLMRTGAELIDLLADIAGSAAFEQIVQFFEEALPMVVEFFAELGEGFAGGEEGAFTVGVTLKSLLGVMKSLVAVAEPIGTAVKYIITGIMGVFSAGVVAGLGLMKVVSESLIKLTALVGVVGEVMGMMPDWALSVAGLPTQFNDLGDSMAQWSVKTTASIANWANDGRDRVADFLEGIWSADKGVADFGATLDGSLGTGEERMDRFAAATERFHDVLGTGAEVLGNYARANNLTSEQINAAAQAASDATNQFKNTTDLIGKLREEAAKPIDLNINFDKTKLDLNSLVNYVDAQVETTREKVSTALYADPGAQDLAAGVIGADGTNLAGLTDEKITEKFVPAHLETSVMDSITELMDNLDRDIANNDYLTSLEFNGFSDLADQLREFDGPKLELAIQELGDAGSAKVREANEKLKEAQRKADEGFNPIQAAIGDAQKAGVLKVRQVQVVKELETKGFSNLAAEYASLKPEDLEAALRSYEAMGGADGPLAQQMEQQLKDLQAALEANAVAIDPLGKMWETLGDKGVEAQMAAIDRFLTADEIAVALGQKQGDWTEKQQANDDILSILDSAIFQTPEGGRTLNMTAADVQRWKDLYFGTLPEGAAPMTEAETKFIAQLKLRREKGEGAAGPAGEAEASAAGNAIAAALGDGMSSEEATGKIAASADTLMGTAVQKVSDALEGRKLSLTRTGEAFYFAISDAISLMLVTEAPTLANGFIEVITGYFVTKVDGWAGPIRTIGRAFVGYIIDGMTAEAGERFPEVVDGLYRGIIALLTVGVVENLPTFFGAGAMMGAVVAAGIASEIDTAVGGVDLMFVALVAALGRGSITSLDTYLSTGKAVALFVAAGIASQHTAIDTGVEALMDQIVDALDRTEARGVQRAAAVGAAIAAAISAGLSVSVGGGGEGDQGLAETGVPGIGIGSAIVDGIILGMALRLPDLIAAATAIATVISTVLTTAMQIRSPSKVTTSIGEQIAEGLAAGLDNSHERVAGAARALTGTLGANLGMPEIPAARLAPGDTPYPPSVTAGRPDTLEAVQAFAAARTANVAPAPSNGAETGAEGGWRGRGRPAGSEGAFIHADVVNINGVPGAAEIPARTRAGFWRLNYGENTTRGTE